MYIDVFEKQESNFINFQIPWLEQPRTLVCTPLWYHFSQVSLEMISHQMRKKSFNKNVYYYIKCFAGLNPLS